MATIPTLQTKVIGAKELDARLTRAMARVEAIKPVWLPIVGNAVNEGIAEEILDQRLVRTFTLMQSGRVFSQTKHGISVGYGKDLDYAQALEFGARPHLITAGGSSQGIGGGATGHYSFVSLSGDEPGRDWSGRRFLSFELSDGSWFFGPQVKHPGNKPYRYIYKGTMRAIPRVLKVFQGYLRAVFEWPL